MRGTYRSRNVPRILTTRYARHLSGTKCAAHTDYPIFAAPIVPNRCREYRIVCMRGIYWVRYVPRILTILYARHLLGTIGAAHIDYPLCAAQDCPCWLSF